MKNTFSLAAVCLACCGALMLISTPSVDFNDPTSAPLKPEGDKLMTPILDGHKFDTPILGPASF